DLIYRQLIRADIETDFGSQKRAAYAALSTTSSLAAELGAALVRSLPAQLLFDAQQLVVLGHAIRTAQRTGLDLTRGSTNSQVGNGVIFGFTGTVRDHCRVAGGLRHPDRFPGPGRRAVLVGL